MGELGGFGDIRRGLVGHRPFALDQRSEFVAGTTEDALQISDELRIEWVLCGLERFQGLIATSDQNSEKGDLLMESVGFDAMDYRIMRRPKLFLALSLEGYASGGCTASSCTDGRSPFGFRHRTKAGLSGSRRSRLATRRFSRRASSASWTRFRPGSTAARSLS